MWCVDANLFVVFAELRARCFECFPPSRREFCCLLLRVSSSGNLNGRLCCLYSVSVTAPLLETTTLCLELNNEELYLINDKDIV